MSQAGVPAVRPLFRVRACVYSKPAMKTLRFWWWTLAGNLFLLGVPLVYWRGVFAVAGIACDWIGYCPPPLEGLAFIDRDHLGAWITLAAGLGCSYIAWEEEFMREVTLGLWTLTVFLGLLSYGVVRVP